MHQILHPGEQRKGAIAAVEFEGEPYGAGVSFFIGDLEPGKGPRLHKHPYRRDMHRSLRSSGDDGRRGSGPAGPGDIVVIAPETPHRFTAVGDERLVAVCIHAAERFVIEWLAE